MRALPVTTQSIRRRKVAYIVLGAALIVLGLAAMAAPTVSSEAIERIIGWLLLLGGIATGIMTWFSDREGWPAWLALGGAVAAVAAGTLLLFSPLGGREMMGSILVGFFAASAFAKLGLALFQRASLDRIWPWLLASGLIDVVLAFAVFLRWPFDTGWFLGLMMGISLVGSGALIAWIALTNPVASGERR